MQLVKKVLCYDHIASISSIHRLFSTSLPLAESITGNPPIKPPFAVEYLVKSCGIPMEKATNASKYILHLRSPANADSVLQFLREIGLDEADIKKTITCEPRILNASLEKTIKPRVMEIRELGFSPSQVARLVPLTPIVFRINYSSLQRNIEFWTSFLGSLECIILALKKAPYLLTVNLEKVVKPNISFLREHCGVSPAEIGKAIIRVPSIFTMNPNNVAAKINNLKNIGFSKEEIDSMMKKQPVLLTNSEERTRRNIGFLTSEAGLDLAYIARYPTLISYSSERRLIPRNYVLKSLKSKALCENFSFHNAICVTEESFADKFVSPYKDLIPEVFEAYEAALAGKISLKGKL